MCKKKENIKSIKHIYIHIPFCYRKCSYCDFTVFVGKKNWFERYFEALKNEINTSLDLEEEFLAQQNIPVEPLSSIYFGGGTPSFVPCRYIAEILNLLKEKRNFSKNIEITIEVNPGDVSKEDLDEYLNMGINRLSIGIQSINDSILQDIGRNHSHKDTIYLLEQVKERFSLFSIDLMVGLPKQTNKDIKETIEWLKIVRPPHISAYSLILEEKTHFWYRFGPAGKESLPDEDSEREQWYLLRDALKSLGYNHYEISNFALPQYESVHNTAYWLAREYHGFGVGAARYLFTERSENVNSLRLYCSIYGDQNLIKNYQENSAENFRNLLPFFNFPYVNREYIDLYQRQCEFFLLGFRMLQGISVADFENIFKTKLPLIFQEKLNNLVKRGLIIPTDDLKNKKTFYKLTLKGEDFANQVFGEFLSEK